MNTLSTNLIQDAKIVIALGSGGVGKTTSSLGIALAAAYQGKKVCLLSIDPAKRLAAALGIKLGSELSTVQLPNNTKNGSLDAAMLDQKAVFDEMVGKFTSDLVTYKKILDHPIYQAASEKFGGALEYMAVAKLQKIVDEDQFDLIVLDTPPDTHALEFLSKPNILAGFMENKVMTWLIKPIYFAQKLGLGKLAAMGERLAGGIAKVTGVKSLHLLAELLVLMQDTIEGFHKSSERITEILHYDSTKFLLVTALHTASHRSTLHILKEISERNFQIDLVLINRTIPDAAKDSIAKLPLFYPNTDEANPLLSALYNKHLTSEQIKEALVSKLQTQANKHIAFADFPERTYPLQNIEELSRFATELSLTQTHK